MRRERLASISRALRAAVTARAGSPRLMRDAATLDSPRFAGEPLLEACFEDRARMDVGTRDTATQRPVSRVQQALIDRGFDLGPSGADGIYGAKTAAAVRAFKQTESLGSEQFGDVGPGTMHRLNELFPQAGPVPPGPTPPRPPAPPRKRAKKDCATYAPGERERSLSSRGTVVRGGTFGKVLTLSNFGAGESRMKREHEDALRELIREFDLNNPKSDFEIEFIRGFTDAVDAEDKNLALREARADDVQFIFKRSGVPGAPDGTAADVTSYDNGCTPETHSRARRVVVQLRKKASPTPKPKTPSACRVPSNPDLSGKAFNPTSFGESVASALNPTGAIAAALHASSALESASAASSGLPGGREGLHLGPADAFRHALWNCQMAKDPLLGKGGAEMFATAHENSNHSSIPFDDQMDLHNNTFGRSLSNSDNCEAAVRAALTKGELRTVRDPNTVIPSECIGPSDQPWP